MNVPDSVPRARSWVGRAFEDIPNFLSLLVFFSVTALLFRSLEFALIVTASLGFHELGHAALLSYFRLKWRIAFGLVGAWTWSPVAEREKLSNLVNSFIHLGGPVFSLLLAQAALGFAAVFPSDNARLLLLANFSAQVCLLNLLPLGQLTDGGKVVRRILAPLGCTGRLWAAVLPLLVTALMLLVYILAGWPALRFQQTGSFWLAILLLGIWMTSSLLLEARKVSPPEKSTGLPITRLQGFLMLMILWGLLALSLIISAATPFWLAPEYVIGSLKNISAVLQFFTRSAL